MCVVLFQFVRKEIDKSGGTAKADADGRSVPLAKRCLCAPQCYGALFLMSGV